jgi:hypothetical protein
MGAQWLIENGSDGFLYERVLWENGFRFSFRTNGENSLEMRVCRELARKRNGTYCLRKGVA